MIKNGEEGKQELSLLFGERRHLNKDTCLLEIIYFKLNCSDSVFVCKEKTKHIFKTVCVNSSYDEEREEIWARLFCSTGKER